MTRRFTLQSRLIAGTIALLALVCLVIGGLSLVLLRGFLVDQLDDQLASAAGRSGAPGYPSPGALPDRGGGASGGDIDFLLFPGQNVGTLGANLDDGRVALAAVLSSAGTLQELTAQQYAVLEDVPTDGRPRSVAVGDLGDYRVLAVEGDRGDGLLLGLSLRSVQQTVTRLALVEAAVALLGLLLTGLAGALLITRSLRPLDRVAATATRVSELPLDRGEVALAERVPDVDADPRTEVGQVGAALNKLLGHVGAALTARQASETRVRRFVADASHELRTPLASIRGYAELTRRRGAALDPDTAHALNRVESEANRMTLLVEDLLLLARLDSGRPLEREPVELSRLAIDAVSDARAAAPEHRWSLRLPPEELVVTGDVGRLHQVLANLLANARTHTPPGSHVTTTVTAEQDAALLLVEDDGPGIDPDLLPNVFERFTRGDASRSRTAGSTGLGLAIVAAVAAAHGGRVEVRSTAAGTTFAVHLPRPPVTSCGPEGSVGPPD
ncbi:MAG: HAMP domain-containing histidine kinase [Actinomycetota bacterium]|nr:HAMP domain-containing histidine kinase [Actinomycetota bacterium]